MIKGAIFDMDGLMFDTETIFNKAWIILSKKYDFSLSDKMFENIRGTAGTLLKEIIKKYIFDIDPDMLVDELYNTARKLLQESVPLKKGIEEILDYLYVKNIKIAIASSSPIDLIESNLRTSKLEKYFDAIVSGNQVKHGKPSPDIFLLACKKLSIKPSECLVFEDALNGVRAGINAGCHTIMIPDFDKPTNYEYKYTYGIYPSLLEALDKLKEEL